MSWLWIEGLVNGPGEVMLTNGHVYVLQSGRDAEEERSARAWAMWGESICMQLSKLSRGSNESGRSM